MKSVYIIIIHFLIFFISGLPVLAHETQQPHKEPIPTIDPYVAAGVVVVILVFAFLVWKFLLQKETSAKNTNK